MQQGFGYSQSSTTEGPSDKGEKSVSFGGGIKIGEEAQITLDYYKGRPETFNLGGGLIQGREEGAYGFYFAKGETVTLKNAVDLKPFINKIEEKVKGILKD